MPIHMVPLTPQEENAEAFTEARRILADRERATLEALADADALKIANDLLVFNSRELDRFRQCLAPAFEFVQSNSTLFPLQVGDDMLPAIVEAFLRAYVPQAEAVQAQAAAGTPAEPSRQALEDRIHDLEVDVARQIERAGKSEAEKRDLTRIVSALRIDLAARDKAFAPIEEIGGIEAFRQRIADAARSPLMDRIAALESDVASMRDAANSARRALAGICPF